MEQHRDEHLHCADCGVTFIFSADEAAVFVERGLAAPKRCKDCRRARKQRAVTEGQDGHRRFGVGAHPGGNQAGRWNGRGRGPAVRPHAYTGDVNEYRSPMQDSFSGSPYGMAPRRPWQGPGEYRSPMATSFAPEGGPRRSRGEHDGNVRANARAPFGAPGRDASPRSRGSADDGPAPRSNPAKHGGQPAVKAARRRPEAAMFGITCTACGAQAEVPFKPAEGRDVYCPTCYRARRPPA